MVTHDDYYGLAYRDSYERFEYGDLKGEDGKLPKCFEDDIECQNVYANRENFKFAVLGSVITVVIIIVIAWLCYLTR